MGPLAQPVAPFMPHVGRIRLGAGDVTCVRCRLIHGRGDLWCAGSLATVDSLGGDHTVPVSSSRLPAPTGVV